MISNEKKEMPLSRAEVYPQKQYLTIINLSCCSVAQSCPTLCHPIDCSTPGFPVLHHLPELAQTHVHWVDDVIQLSHSLMSTSPPAFNLSQHQGLFWWVSFETQGQTGELSLSARFPGQLYCTWFSVTFCYRCLQTANQFFSHCPPAPLVEVLSSLSCLFNLVCLSLLPTLTPWPTTQTTI